MLLFLYNQIFSCFLQERAKLQNSCNMYSTKRGETVSGERKLGHSKYLPPLLWWIIDQIPLLKTRP